MSKTRRWKAEELIVAKIFGTSRRLMKGTKEKADIGDEKFPLMVDVKLRQKAKWQIVKWFKEIEEAGIQKEKWPILVIREPGKKRRYAILRKEPMVRYMVQKTRFCASNWFVRTSKPSARMGIVREWDTLVKDKQYAKRRAEVTEVYPILMMRNVKHDINFMITTPEVLAIFFNDGGLINLDSVQDSHTNSQKSVSNVHAG